MIFWLNYSYAKEKIKTLNPTATKSDLVSALALSIQTTFAPADNHLEKTQE